MGLVHNHDLDPGCIEVETPEGLKGSCILMQNNLGKRVKVTMTGLYTELSHGGAWFYPERDTLPIPDGQMNRIYLQEGNHTFEELKPLLPTAPGSVVKYLNHFFVLDRDHEALMWSSGTSVRSPESMSAMNWELVFDAGTPVFTKSTGGIIQGE